MCVHTERGSQENTAEKPCVPFYVFTVTNTCMRFMHTCVQRHTYTVIRSGFHEVERQEGSLTKIVAAQEGSGTHPWIWTGNSQEKRTLTGHTHTHTFWEHYSSMVMNLNTDRNIHLRSASIEHTHTPVEKAESELFLWAVSHRRVNGHVTTAGSKEVLVCVWMCVLHVDVCVSLNLESPLCCTVSNDELVSSNTSKRSSKHVARDGSRSVLHFHVRCTGVSEQRQLEVSVWWMRCEWSCTGVTR